MLRNHLRIRSGRSNSTTNTWYLFMDSDTYVTHIKQISQFPTLVPAHRAEVRGAHRLRTAALYSRICSYYHIISFHPVCILTSVSFPLLIIKTFLLLTNIFIPCFFRLCSVYSILSGFLPSSPDHLLIF